MSQPAGPEVRFRVGEIRLTLWPAERDQSIPAYDLALDRRHLTGDGEVWTGIFHSSDVTAAILALKKANDYVKRQAKTTPIEGHFHTTTPPEQTRVP